MALMGSCLFGLNRQYDICGININFNNEYSGLNMFGNNFFSNTTNFLLNNSVIKVATFGYLHVFIHEIGHALAAKLCGKDNVSINIYTKTCRGDYKTTGTENLFITLAGPVLGTLWEIAKLTAAIALIILLPPPIGIPLGIFIGAGSVCWIFGEMAYAFSRNGDWNFLR